MLFAAEWGDLSQLLTISLVAKYEDPVSVFVGALGGAVIGARAYAMPLTSPAFPPGPYRFVNREFFIITYRTDREKLRALVPEPLEIVSDLVKFEFIRMPDSTAFGDYTEAGQVIPVRLGARTETVRLMTELDPPTGAKLYFSDGSIQHAGHCYWGQHYHHPFRFRTRDDAGPFAKQVGK